MFLCNKMIDGIDYAVKKVNLTRGGLEGEHTQRVLREVKLLAKFDDVNIVRFYNAWVEQVELDKMPAELQGTEETTEDLTEKSLITQDFLLTNTLGTEGGVLSTCEETSSELANASGMGSFALGEGSFCPFQFEDDSSRLTFSVELLSNSGFKLDTAESSEEEEEEFDSNSHSNSRSFHSSSSASSSSSSGSSGSSSGSFSSSASTSNASSASLSASSSSSSSSSMASSYSYSTSHTPASPSQVSPHSQSQSQSKEHNEPSIESIESQPIESIESTQQPIESTQQPIESQSAVVASTADTPNPNPTSNSNPNAPTGAASGMRGRRRVRRRCSVSAQSGLSDLLQQYALVLYIQMAYCGRTTLENYLKDPARVVRQRELLDVCMQLCHALTYIHGKNVIHRDVKPANIFYGEDKVVRLGDFGLSRIINDANPVSTFGSTLPLVGFPRETRGQLASLQFIGFRHDDTHRNTNLRVTGTIRGEFHLRLQKRRVFRGNGAVRNDVPRVFDHDGTLHGSGESQTGGVSA